MDRRAFLCTGGLALSTGFVGCLGTDDENERGVGTAESEEPSGIESPSEISISNLTSEFEPSNQSPAVEGADGIDAANQSVGDFIPTPVDPVVIATDSTEPRAVDIREEALGQQSEFTATIQNTGIDGEIGVELYWIRDLDEGWRGVENFGNRKKEAERVVYFDAGERRDVSFIGSPPQEYEGYGFEFFNATFVADVRNDGGAGDVDVKLLTPPPLSGVVERQTVFLDDGETRRVEFTTDSSILRDDFEIDAEPAVH